MFASVVIALGACATADNGGGGNGNVDAPGSDNVDAPGGGNVDAPGTPIDAPAGTIDAAPQTVTLSLNSANTIVAGTVSCNKGTPGFVTAENSYYRVFQLSSFGVVRPFTAQRIDFGVESANAEVGTSQVIQVKLHTLTGAFVTGNLTPVAGQNVNVADTTTGVVVPVALSPAPVIEPSATLVAEVFIPDGDIDDNNVGNSIFMGSNTAAQTGPSYIRAPATGCDFTQPANMASLTPSNLSVVLTVTGVY
jgi:hypothetical protein